MKKTVKVIIIMKLVKNTLYFFFIMLSMFPNNSHLYLYPCFQTVPNFFFTYDLYINFFWNAYKQNLKFRDK